MVPAPTIAFTCVLLMIEKEVAGVPPKVTDVAPLKLLPEIPTVVPVPLLAGEKDVIFGPVNVKPASEEEPVGVVTTTEPLEPGPTMADILVAEFTTKDCAGTPPKVTAEASVKFVPVIVTVLPWKADVGANEVTVGPVKVKPASVAVPPGVVKETEPLLPKPTVAVTLVLLTEFIVEALVTPNLTLDAPAMLLPEIVINEPFDPLVGEKEVITGAASTKPVLDALPY